jgi:nucleoid-associated protein YgaU
VTFLPDTSDLANVVDRKLEQAYLLIIPPSSPAGGAASAALAAAGIGADEGASLATGGGGGGTAGEQAAYGDSAVSTTEAEIGGNAGGKITFLFNPQQYTVEKSADWSREPQVGALLAPVPQFRGTNARVMNVDILLDASYSTSGSVENDVNLLFSCCAPTAMSVLLGTPSPPFVLFGWGTTLGFLAYMRSVRAEYTLFRPDGAPLRANCSLVMEEIPMQFGKQNPTSGGRARRTRTTVAGDTLQSVAYREYGRPALWRAIAEANGIEDPLRLAPGTTLLIPPPDEAAAMA